MAAMKAWDNEPTTCRGRPFAAYRENNSSIGANAGAKHLGSAEIIASTLSGAVSLKASRRQCRPPPPIPRASAVRPYQEFHAVLCVRLAPRVDDVFELAENVHAGK